jgi:hypothetical protein
MNCRRALADGNGSINQKGFSRMFFKTLFLRALAKAVRMIDISIDFG